MITRILGIGCSPRHQSNSKTLLDHSLSQVSEKYGPELEYHTVDLRDYNIEHCQGCGICGKTTITGEYIDCLLKDDVNGLLEMMSRADAIVVATPVRLGMPSDLFVKFMQRTRVLRNQDFKLANKPVGILAVSRRRSGGSEPAIIHAGLPFVRHGCLLVGGGTKASLYGAVGWATSRRHILSDKLGLEQGVATVSRVIEIARLLQAGTEAMNYSPDMQFCYMHGSRTEKDSSELV